MSTISLVDKGVQAATNSIVSLNISPTAKMIGQPLVEAWIRRFGENDAKFIHVFVEAPFYVQVEPKLFVVGVMDNARAWPTDLTTLIGCEWKTAKAPKKTQYGRDSAWWNEEVWLGELREGVQIATYALAMHEGKFLVGPGTLLEPAQKDPLIMIRAVVKDAPPRFWPTDPRNGEYRIPEDALKYVRSAYKSRAAVIRTLRNRGEVPWKLPGYHCKKYNRVCEFYEECTNKVYPPAEIESVPLQPHDPANAIMSEVARVVDIEDPEVVILSQSAYQDGSQCEELWRRRTIKGAAGEENDNLDIGTVFHAGVGAFNKLIMTQQREAKGE